jgi:hypothetical protein
MLALAISVYYSIGAIFDDIFWYGRPFGVVAGPFADRTDGGYECDARQSSTSSTEIDDILYTAKQAMELVDRQPPVWVPGIEDDCIDCGGKSFDVRVAEAQICF